MNVLIEVNDGISLCTFNGACYPIVRVSDYAEIACHNKKTADSISLRTGGEIIETPESEFPFEVKIKIEQFDKIINANSWVDIIEKYMVNINK